MAGFLTYYLFGMESCDMLSDNYIHEVIKKNNHAFLLGLQGNNLLSFNPHTLSKRGLSYRTASLTLRNQEYAAFFNNMLDTLSGMADQERDVCIAYIFPRYSKTGINILAWMRSRGVKIVLITSNNNLPVRSYGDICFRCAIQSVSCKNSLTAPMCLTNYLVAELALRNYDEAHEVLSRTEDILSTGFYLGI